MLCLYAQVLIRLIGADEHIYANYAEAMRWLEDTNVLEMIVDKFSSCVSHSGLADLTSVLLLHLLQVVFLVKPV